MDLKKHLNNAQYEATTTLSGPLLVIAGAGSGKTRVIEYRSLNLILNGIAPESILLLTFTRKAASMMLSRASRHNPLCHKIDGGTFHSFAYKTLKRYGPKIGIPSSFTVLDAEEQEQALRKALKSVIDTKSKTIFPKKSTLRNIISKATNKNTSISQIIDQEYPQYIDLTPRIEQIRDIYQTHKSEKGYLDFDDLLIKLKEILETEHLNSKIADRYSHIMIDEYQDTNELQGDITYLLGKKHTNIMVVGDDAQSIYGFRGATHRNIMQFPTYFQNCKIIKLEQNYRSTQLILDLANTILSNMETSYEKSLKSIQPSHGPKPQICIFNNQYRESDWIIDKITDLKTQGVPLREISVLFRSAYISIILQAGLTKMNIPYELRGGRKFYETAHVKDAMSFMKIVQNHRNDIAWTRLLTLLDGIGAKTAEKITKQIDKSESLTETVTNILPIYTKQKKYSPQIQGLITLLKDIKESNTTVGDKFALVLDIYKDIMEKKFDDWRIRIKDLETLSGIADKYSSLQDFLSDFSIEPPDQKNIDILTGTKKDKDRLILSTIHSAKGLEWSTVFLLGATDGILPSALSFDSHQNMEEEHRLLYVAVTRARQNLILTSQNSSNNYNYSYTNKLSRFIKKNNILQHFDHDLPAQDTYTPGYKKNKIYSHVFSHYLDNF